MAGTSSCRNTDQDEVEEKGRRDEFGEEEEEAAETEEEEEEDAQATR